MTAAWRLTWTGAFGSGISGERPVDSAAELDRVLGSFDEDVAVEFELASAGAEYPWMALSTSGSRWYVHWFPEEGDPGASAVGDDPSAVGTTRMAGGSDIVVLASQTMAGAAARAVAAEFLATGRRPDSVGWTEL